MEIVGMAHCEIGIVQTEIEKQILTNIMAVDANCNTWHKYVEAIREEGPLKEMSILLTFISWRDFDLFRVF